jgi:hypothetical protein
MLAVRCGGFVRWALPGLISLLIVESAAQATVIIENASINDGTQHSFAAGQDWVKAIGFTMGATPFQLDSVSLRLCFEEEGANHCPGTFAGLNDAIPAVRLFSDVAGAPGAELLTFSNPVFAVGVGDYHFLPPEQFTLMGGASYWLVVHSSNGEAFAWEANDPATTPSGEFATHLGALARIDSAPTPPGSEDLTEVLNIYTLNGTAVPEPGTLSTVAIGIILMSVLRGSRPREEPR